MPSDRASQTIRRRRLAAELRRLREHAGLTGDEAAERLGWSGSKISRIETHRIGVKRSDLTKLLDLYGVAAPHRDELQALAKESDARGWLDALGSLPTEYAAYIYAEAEAQTTWNWEPQVVPGLLQTAGYALAVMQGWQSIFALPPGDAERRAEIRHVRQQVLTRDKPLEVKAVIDESVLYRRFGGREVMQEQLDQLGRFAELPNVELRILSLNAENPMAAGPFSYMKFASVHDVPLADLVIVEHLTGSYYLEEEEDTHKYRVTFEYLIANSLDPSESWDRIRTAAQGWA
jgi:transcriptional regulator with XRE-family HTH domain